MDGYNCVLIIWYSYGGLSSLHFDWCPTLAARWSVLVTGNNIAVVPIW